MLEPFSQAHQHHGGDLAIESVEGAGTTVTLRLLAERPQDAPRALHPVRFLRTAAQIAMPDA